MTAGVLLLGASGLAREVIAAGIADVVGILDDDTRLHGTEMDGVPIVGPIEDAVSRPERLLACIGPSDARRRVVLRLRRRGAGDDRFAAFVAPSSRIGRGSTVGAGAIVLDGVVATAHVGIGAHVVVMPGVVLTHEDVLAPFATLAAGVVLGGGVSVGEAAYLGMNASVHPGRRIGDAAVVGMGAVVLADVPKGQTWVGVPARVRPASVPQARRAS